MEMQQRESLNLTIDQLRQSVDAIDREFGKGFAKANPVFLGSFMITFSNNSLSTSLYSELNNITKIIEKQRN